MSTEIKKYMRIKIVPLTPFGVCKHPGLPQFDSLVTYLHRSNEDEVLNKELSEGWEVIQFETHHSTEHNVTGIVAILGHMSSF